MNYALYLPCSSWFYRAKEISILRKDYSNAHWRKILMYRFCPQKAK